MSTGFHGDDFDGTLLPYVYPGTVVRNDDPDRLGRVTVRVPGIIETESTWALPRAGGAAKWGANAPPPVGADVYVQFLAGRVDQPIYEPGPHGVGEAFPEHVSPEVYVLGIGAFRLIIDTRADQNVATLAVVKTNPATNAEEQVASISLNANTNSVLIDALTAVAVNAGGVVSVDSNTVQVRGRTVMPTARPIN